MWQEAGNGEVVSVAIGDADVSNHHQEAGCSLSRAIPFLLGNLGQGNYIQANAGRIDWGADYFDAVLVDLLELDVIGKAAAVASRYADTLGLLSVIDDKVGIGIERDFLDESLVLRPLRQLDGRMESRA